MPAPPAQRHSRSKRQSSEPHDDSRGPSNVSACNLEFSAARARCTCASVDVRRSTGLRRAASRAGAPLPIAKRVRRSAARARGRAGCAPCVPGAMPPKAAAAAAAAAAAGAEAADSGAGAGGPVYKKARNANPGVRVVGACCRCCVGAARGCGVAGAAALESCFDSSAFGGKADARRCGALATRRRAHLRLGQRQDVPPGASRGRGARSGAQADAAASRSAVPPEDDRAEGALRRRRPRRGGDQGPRVRRVLVREVPVQPVRTPQTLAPGPFVLRTAC
jgi:hypothetical protein